LEMHQWANHPSITTIFYYLKIKMLSNYFKYKTEEMDMDHKYT